MPLYSSQSLYLEPPPAPPSFVQKGFALHLCSYGDITSIKVSVQRTADLHELTSENDLQYPHLKNNICTCVIGSEDQKQSPPVSEGIISSWGEKQVGVT